MRREIIAIVIGVLVTLGILVGLGVHLAKRSALAESAATLDLARSLAEDGDWLSVIDALRGAPPPASEMREERLLLLARAFTALGDDQGATAQWREVFETSGDLRLRGRALLELAAAEVRRDDLDAAEGLLERFGELRAPGLNDRFLYTRAAVLQSQRQTQEAAEVLAEARRRYPDSELVEEIEDELSEVNLSLLFSRQPRESDELHTIQEGDTLEALGRRHEVSPSLIQRVNSIDDPRRLRVGNRIKIPHSAFHIEVYKDEFRLYVFDDGKFFARYPCRIGRLDYMTPEEVFHIQTRTTDPTWTDPSGRVIAAGDPENELGSRWMGFRENPSLGIHGTIHPETIGKAASNGCIGLLKGDVEELFDLIPRGTEVRIYRSREQAERERRGV